MQELENYRKEIDKIDNQIIELLFERFEVVKKV
jgi:chorismate mutase